MLTLASKRRAKSNNRLPPRDHSPSERNLRGRSGSESTALGHLPPKLRSVLSVPGVGPSVKELAVLSSLGVA